MISYNTDEINATVRPDISDEHLDSLKYLKSKGGKVKALKEALDRELSDLHDIAFHKGDKPSMDMLEQVKLLIKTLTEVYEGKLWISTKN